MNKLDGYKKILLDQEEEKRKIKEKNTLKKIRSYYLLIELFLFSIGLIIIGYNTNWWVSFGLFLVLWGNNMGVNRISVSTKLNSVKNIWSKD